MANIVFRVPQKLYILSDFTKETLDKISDKMWEINKTTGSNECNFYDFEEFIRLESIKAETKILIKQLNYGMEFIHIEIDTELHKIINKRKMNRIPLDTFKGLYLHTVMVSKKYEIESNTDKVIKIKGIEKEINLRNVKYEYLIEE